MNWYAYCANNPLIYIDPNGLKAVLEAHGLNSGGEKEWEKMNEYLKNTGGFEIGGIINGGYEFVNRDLFTAIEWEEIEKNIEDLSPEEKREILQPLIQAKVAELDEQGTDVLFMMNFSNNQDDFRKQGAELKKAIDLVKPANQKVNVLAHSMGSLATASYISGISGVEYANDIDTFVAIGAPFKGSSLAYVGDFLGDGLPGSLRRHGPAYHNLRPDSGAISQLQEAWNGKTHNVNFHSLQCTAGDLVVSWGSSTSLSGSKNHSMPFTIHTGQTKNINYQNATYQLLRNGTIEYNQSYDDLSWWERMRMIDIINTKNIIM